MKWYHEEILKTFKERHGMTDIEIARNKKALEHYDTDAQREEYLKAIIRQYGERNLELREFRKLSIESFRRE